MVVMKAAVLGYVMAAMMVQQSVGQRVVWMVAYWVACSVVKWDSMLAATTVCRLVALWVALKACD
jgi:hypothetical protein